MEDWAVIGRITLLQLRNPEKVTAQPPCSAACSAACSAGMHILYAPHLHCYVKPFKTYNFLVDKNRPFCAAIMKPNIPCGKKLDYLHTYLRNNKRQGN